MWKPFDIYTPGMHQTAPEEMLPPIVSQLGPDAPMPDMGPAPDRQKISDRMARDLRSQYRQYQRIAGTLPPDLQEHGEVYYRQAAEAIQSGNLGEAEEIMQELRPSRMAGYARAREEAPKRRARVDARLQSGAARPMVDVGDMIGMNVVPPQPMGQIVGQGGRSRSQQPQHRGLSPYQMAQLQARQAGLRERQRQFDTRQKVNEQKQLAEVEEDKRKEEEAKRNQERRSRQDLREEYFDLARNLYNVPEDQRQIMAQRMREIQQEIFSEAAKSQQPKGKAPMGPIGQDLMAGLKEIASQPAGPGYAPLPSGVADFAEPGMSSGARNALSDMDQYLNRQGLMGIPMDADLEGMKLTIEDLRESAYRSGSAADRKVLKNILKVYDDMVKKATTRRLDSQRTLSGPIGY